MQDGKLVSLGYEGHKYNFDAATGLLASIETSGPSSGAETVSHSVKEDFRNYHETGGAYLFMPKGPSVAYEDANEKKKVKILEGTVQGLAHHCLSVLSNACLRFL